MPEPSHQDFRQHLELETPEHVMLDYELAGVGSRAAAALADWAIIIALNLALILGVSALGGMARLPKGWLIAGVIVILYGIVWGYFTLFEGLRNGQTPGKRWLGIRTIRDTGHGVTFAEAAARNLLLPLDMAGMIGIILVAVHPKAKRLGDLVAGTVVVRDRPVLAQQMPVVTTIDDAVPVGAPQLDDREFHLLREFAGREASLPIDVRTRFAAQLAGRFSERFPEHTGDDLAFLLQLHGEELARRRGRFGASGIGAGGHGSGRSVAERLVSLKGARWAEFQAIAERVTAKGLDALSASELAEFAARYREVAADLARARTYHADGVVLAQLERLVAAGHGALYRDEPQTWRRIWQFVSEDCPGAVVQSWRQVAVAYLVFLVPAGAGYALLRSQPSLAPELIPDTMLERAEAGAARMARGEGYVLASSGFRPALAAGIMTNNVKVAFNCFAGGVVLGVGSLVVLGYNGLMLGSIAGHYANVGMLGYLGTFVVGHGVLEISALCFASAAGFLIGLAIIAPGSLTRKDALAIAGHRAVRLIGAVVVMLVVAGTIEGFVSSSGLSLIGRLAISGGSAVFLLVYLANGWRSAKRA